MNYKTLKQLTGVTHVFETDLPEVVNNFLKDGYVLLDIRKGRLIKNAYVLGMIDGASEENSANVRNIEQR